MTDRKPCWATSDQTAAGFHPVIVHPDGRRERLAALFKTKGTASAEARHIINDRERKND